MRVIDIEYFHQNLETWQSTLKRLDTGWLTFSINAQIVNVLDL